jgi:hypothetical protein
MPHAILAWVMAVALQAGSQTPRPTEPALPAGIYQGTYVCPQGETALTLTVSAPADGQQSAEFAFGGNAGLPTGAYLVRVLVDQAGGIVLIPQQWLRKPDGYEMVGARLHRDGDQLSGTIVNSACRDIGLHRVAESETRPGS